MVTTGRFEIERNGEIAYLEYSLSPGVLELIHTEVPKALYGSSYFVGRNWSPIRSPKQP